MSTQDMTEPTVFASTFEFPEGDGEPRFVSLRKFPADKFAAMGRPYETYEYPAEGRSFYRTVYMRDDARPMDTRSLVHVIEHDDQGRCISATFRVDE